MDVKPGAARRLCAAAAVLAAALAHAQTPRPAPDRPLSMEFKMAINDAMFDQVMLNRGGRSACSPAEPPLPWRGLVIQAPSQIGYRPGKPVDGQFAGIPICGYYRLDMDKLLDGKPLTLVAVNVKDQTRYSGPVIDEDPAFMEPNPDERPLDPARLKGMASGAYFNPNLARYVALPATNAVYQVHAEYGGSVSNTVQIAVTRR